MFTNPYKRKINLSTNKTLTKQELLLKNQREREARATAEREERAALTLQRAWMMFEAKKNAKNLIRNSFGLMSGLASTKESAGESQWQRLSLALLLGDEITGFCSYCLRGWTECSREEQIKRAYLLKRCLEKSCTLTSSIARSISNPSGINNQALKILSKALKEPKIVQHLISSLSSESGLNENISSIDALEAILIISLLPCESNQVDVEFIINVFKIPLLFDSMDQATLQSFIQKFPYQNLLEALSQCPENVKDLYLLSNFIYFSSFQLDMAADLDVKKYMVVINSLLTAIPIPLKKNDDSDSDEESELVDSPINQLAKIPHIEILHSGSHIKTLLIKVSANPTTLALLCTYLVGIMSRFPSQQLKIASLVLYQNSSSTSFLPLCIEYYLSSPLHALFQTSDGFQSAMVDEQRHQDWYVLCILCEFYSRLFLTVSNKEFFSSPELIPIDTITSLTLNLKMVAFNLFWNANEGRLGSSLVTITYLQDAVSRFLALVHVRDVRKKFTEPDHWLITSPDFLVTLDTLPTQNRDSLNDPTSFASLGQDRRVYACTKILHSIPFVIPFETRVKLFRSFLENDVPEPSSGIGVRWVEPSFKAEVQRGRIFEDGFQQLNNLGPKLKERIQISFRDHHGLVEAGIDGGGVFKEFLTESLKQAFDPSMGLFVSTEGNLLYPSPFAGQDNQLQLFEFLGRIIGKALYERVLIDVPFTSFFLNKWLGRKSYVDDLPSLDPEVHQGLMFLKDYDGNVNDLSLSFSLNVDAGNGQTRVVDLVPNGRHTVVTKENRMQYIHLVANYKLNTQIARPCKYFFRGLSDLIKPDWLQMFSESELQVLLGGEQAPINVEEMKKHVVYDGLYDPDHITIQFFWQAVTSFSPDDRALLLKFITSCSRPPLLGFGELNPKICIRFSSADQSRLPTASTCVNLLKLPGYKDFETLKEKLLYAVRSASGFELS